MITNYYTLRALALEWNADLTGSILGDAYSQSKDELTLAFATSESEWMVRIRIRWPFQYLFRVEGYNKARRNVASLFSNAYDRTVKAIRIADRDRMVYIDFTDGTFLQIMVFGSKANVLFVGPDNIVLDAFQNKEALTGTDAPLSRPAPDIDTFDTFKAAWQNDSKSTAKAVSRVYRLFDATLSREVMHRAGITVKTPALCEPADLLRIFEEGSKLHAQLLKPSPRIYWQEPRAVAFSTTSLYEHHALNEECFDTVDAAINLYVRRQLGQRNFDAAYMPLEKALRTARDQNQNRLEKMLTALSEESRAEKYERWGHLLMAAQHDVPPDVDKVQLDDLFNNNQAVTIPLDPRLTGVENAQKYYEKARNTRLARQHAEERLERVETLAEEAASLLNALNALKTAGDIRKFTKAEARRLAPFLGQQHKTPVEQIPFRRYVLGSGYEVWVGRNAKQNDALTFKYARKFDFWLHARGVPGSHAVLRRPGRTAQPQKSILERAAAIAAYYSKARGSSLVPVIVTERKHVRKPKGAAPGAVLVDREDVVLVEPGLPE